MSQGISSSEYSLTSRLYSEEDIPWDTLAFRPVRFTLQHYFADRKAGDFRFRIGDLAAPERKV